MGFQDISVTGIIGLVILAFAVIGFLKGLLRTVLAVVCIGVAGYAGLRGYEHAHELTSPWISSPGPWMPKAVAAVAAIAAFVICRYLLKFIANPFNNSSTGQKLTSGIPSAFLSLCAGLVILWLAFTGVRYGGSLAEIRHTRHALSADTSHESSDQPVLEVPILMQAKNALDSSSIGKLQRATDPLYTPHKLLVCRLLVMYHHQTTREKLIRQPSVRPVIEFPNFQETAYRRALKASAESGKPREIYNSPYVDSLLENKQFSALLDDIDPLILLDVMQAYAH